MSQATQSNELATISGPRLPYPKGVDERFNIDRSAWKALVEAVFPNATSPESVVLALSYCHARKLDVFKRVVHIVPIWSSERKCLVDTVWPGIGELRTTAARTGAYAGRDAAQFGPTRTETVGDVPMAYPEWCQITVYRVVGQIRCAFVGPKVYWMESYATKRRDSDAPNEMWATRPIGQIEKCAEAAALRAAFPEEIGNDYIPEEVEGVRRRSVENTADNSVRAAQGELDKLRAEASERKRAAEQPKAKTTKPETPTPEDRDGDLEPNPEAIARVSGDANAKPPSGWTSVPSKPKPGEQPAPWET